MKPPPVLPAKPRTAALSSSSVMPRARIRAGSGVMRYSRTSPPIGMTCATPGIDSNFGRTVKSAVSRSTIGSASAPASASSMISPITELIGPIAGTTPSGICAVTALRRSATCWRAR
jgi:hypothetical protein